MSRGSSMHALPMIVGNRFDRELEEEPGTSRAISSVTAEPVSDKGT